MDHPADRAAEHQGDSVKERLWRIIFLADSGAARAFDVVLLWLIAGSVAVVMLESVRSVEDRHGELLHRLEWVFTLLFTIEYLLRVWTVRRKSRYVLSFFGVVDLLSILPTYLEIFMTGSGHLIVIRILRLLRMFRILKMAHHMGEANLLLRALRASRGKISVFLFGVLSIVCIEGTLMYLIESGQEDSGFTSIPQAIYWGIVTITTVGYGDIAPVTVVGKILASVMMLTGFAIIAVPTGIVSAELHRELDAVRMDTRTCRECRHAGHDPSASHCKMCGAELPESAKSEPPGHA
ncbi:MAG: ion transporter [Akkermansiaceae bacterium]|nr:ion transporter [Akkermansiaceae bacterium]